jgi:hypothetical protein
MPPLPVSGLMNGCARFKFCGTLEHANNRNASHTIDGRRNLDKHLGVTKQTETVFVTTRISIQIELIDNVANSQFFF